MELGAGESLFATNTIQPGAELPLDLAALISSLGGDPTGAFAEGSIVVYYVGTIMPVVGQVTVTNLTRGLVYEAEMVESDPGRSDIPAVLNGLLWGLAGGRNGEVIITNTSNASVVADVFLDAAGRHQLPTPLSFNPHEAKVVSLAELLSGLKLSPSQASEGGITIIQSGRTPSLIAQGRVLDQASGFSTTLQFPDPARQLANSLHAKGLPIGKPPKGSPYAGTGTFTPHVIVRNLASTPQSVTMTVEYPKNLSWDSVEGAGGLSARAAKRPRVNLSVGTGGAVNPGPDDLTGRFVLAPLRVGPYTTVDFSLDAVMGQLPLPLPFCSIRIEHSGAPGTMIAQVASVEAKSDLVVDARVANEGDGWAGSGANPWHLDDQTESILFLTNEGDQSAPIGFVVTANDVHYYLTKLVLAPHETHAIDMRSLRDAQQHDFRGQTIPPAATDGSINWIRLDQVPVTGRVVVISRRGGLASSYDCNTCNCPASYTGCTISPGPPSCIGPHALMQLVCMANYQNCNSQNFLHDETSLATWSSNNTAVAYMDSTKKGLVHGKAAGSASITATYTDYDYPLTSPCTKSSYTDSYSCPLNVTNSGCPDHLQVQSDGTDLYHCAVGYMVERNTTYAIMDANEKSVAQAEPVNEAFCCFSSNSCNNGQPTPQVCTSTTVAGEFTDHISVGCNSVGGSCGFTMTAQWHWCPLGAAQVALGTFQNDGVYFNKTTILGYTAPPDSGAMRTLMDVYP